MTGRDELPLAPPTRAHTGLEAPARVAVVVGALGNLFSSTADLDEFASGAVSILAREFTLSRVEIRVRVRGHRSDASLASQGPATVPTRTIPISYRGTAVGSLLVPVGAPDLRATCTWLGLAIGSLLSFRETEIALDRSQSRRADFWASLCALLDTHDEAVYLLDPSGRSAPQPLSGMARERDGDHAILERVIRNGAVQDESVGVVAVGSRLIVFLRPTADPDTTSASMVDRFAAAWKLGPGQRRVVHRVVEGECNKEIAAALGLSVVTVEGHLTAIYRRTGVRRRAELVRKVLTHTPANVPGPFSAHPPAAGPALTGTAARLKAPARR